MPPPRIGNPKNGGDQSSPVTDPGEEDKVRDVQAPGNLVAHSGDDQAPAKLQYVTVEPPERDDGKYPEPHIKSPRCVGKDAQQIGFSVGSHDFFSSGLASPGAAYLRLAGGRK